VLDLSLKPTSGTVDRPSARPLDCISRSRLVAPPERSVEDHRHQRFRAALDFSAALVHAVSVVDRPDWRILN
jgi:hypothetical protein